MFKKTLSTVLTTAILATATAVSIAPARADWRNEAIMAAGMATVAAGAASAIAHGGYGHYHRSNYHSRPTYYRPRPTYYRVRPVVECCYERVQWRRAPAYAPY